jgi:hypothetical protein
VTTQCAITIPAKIDPTIFMLGTRDIAAPLRTQVENALGEGSECVCVDFEGLFVSQSFMDEFLGVLIMRHGPAILERISLRNCNDEVKAAANFVASVRAKDFTNARELRATA